MVDETLRQFILANSCSQGIWEQFVLNHRHRRLGNSIGDNLRLYYMIQCFETIELAKSLSCHLEIN